MSVPISKWVWDGYPGHFCCVDRCCFRLNTLVGSHRVSTVGCYHPEGGDPDVLVEIGIGRKFETMVFNVDSNGEISDYNEIDSAGYNTAEDAQAGHMKMCKRYARMED